MTENDLLRLAIQEIADKAPDFAEVTVLGTSPDGHMAIRLSSRCLAIVRPTEDRYAGLSELKADAARAAVDGPRREWYAALTAPELWPDGPLQMLNFQDETDEIIVCYLVAEGHAALTVAA